MILLAFPIGNPCETSWKVICMKLLSLIVPCYNEEAAAPLFYQAVTEVAQTLAHRVELEILFVDDGSKDNTEQDSRVHYLSFSRNFGKEAAMYAGLEHVKGDYVAIMDVDLQDPPSLLPQMMDLIEGEGYDCVATRRVTRKGEPPIRSFFARCFYRIINKISQTEIVDGARDYRLMTRQMVDSILELSEVERFSKGIFAWVGYKTKWYPYENVERTLGTTKWSFRGLFKYAVDGITSFSIAPLRLVSGMGFLISCIAFIYIIITLIQTLIFGIDVPGYVTTLCAVLFLGGIIELSIGILGEYIAHIYMEAKDRPIYIIKESNLDHKKGSSQHD